MPFWAATPSEGQQSMNGFRVQLTTYSTPVKSDFKQHWIRDNLCDQHATPPPQENKNISVKDKEGEGDRLAERACLIGQAALFQIPVSVCGAALSVCRLGLAVQSGPLFFIRLRQVQGRCSLEHWAGWREKLLEPGLLVFKLQAATRAKWESRK